MADLQQYTYTKEDLEQRLAIATEKGDKIQKCLEYAISKLAEYHNTAAKGLIVDDAMYDVYAKFDAALTAYTNYNSRVTKKINGKLESIPVKSNRSSIPRRSIQTNS